MFPVTQETDCGRLAVRATMGIHAKDNLEAPFQRRGQAKGEKVYG